MSRNISAAYAAALFVSSQAFNQKQIDSVSKLLGHKGPEEMLLEVLQKAPEGRLPGGVVAATEALVAAKAKRIEATIAVLKGQQQAVIDGAESFALYVRENGPDAEIEVGDGFMAQMREDTLDELELVHAAELAQTEADAQMDKLRAENPLLAQARQFGEQLAPSILQ